MELEYKVLKEILIEQKRTNELLTQFIELQKTKETPIKALNTTQNRGRNKK